MTITQASADSIHRRASRRCPYNGLQAYTECDSDYFFGRDTDRDLVIANLMASRLTVLYGPSGVGKSSLLQAGILPRLRQMSGAAFSYLAPNDAIVVYHSSWRDDPLADLGDSIRRALPDDVRGNTPGPLSIDLLRDLTRRLDADMYLLLDQFEEEALYQEGEPAERFAAELGRIVSSQGLRVNVLLGVREDALAKLDRLQAHVPDLFGNSLRLDHLTAEAARDAIEQPLVKYNETDQTHPMTIEPVLVDRLLSELRTGNVSVADAGQGSAGSNNSTIETPFLQLVMTRLWAEEVNRNSSVLSESMLVSLGGASRIVRTHLDAVMSQLSDEQRSIAADVFRYLVTPSGAKIAHTAEDLAEYAGIPDSTPLREMLDELASGQDRVLRPVPPPVDQPGPPRYEIFHDVMGPAVLDWRRRYVDERDRLAAERALVQARHDTEEQHRQTKRRLRRSRLLSAALAVLLAAAITAVVYAKRSSDEAQAGRKLADYQRLLTTDPAAALHDAIQAYHKRASPEAEAAVRSALDADNQLHVLRGHTGIVADSAFAPDGTSLVTAGWDGTARIFDPSTGHQTHLLAPVDGSRSALTNAVFSPDGTMIATAARDGWVRVYSTAGTHVNDLHAFTRPVEISWAPNGAALLTSSEGSEKAPAVLWAPRTNATVTQYGNRRTGAFDARFSRDGAEVVAVGSDTVITVWNTASGARLTQSKPIAEGYSAAFPHFVTPDSHRIAVLAQSSSDAGYPWELFFWDWRTPPNDVTSTSTQMAYPTDFAVSQDGKWIALVADKYTAVYQADDASAYATPVGYTAEQPALIDSVSFSPDSRWLLTGNVDGRSQLWLAHNFLDRQPVAEFVGHGGEILSARFDPHDPSRITTASIDGTARVWAFNSAQVLRPTSYGWVNDAEYSPDGRHIITAQATGHLDIWNTDALSQPLRELTTGGILLSAQFAGTADEVATASQYDAIPRLWNWTTRDQEPTTLAVPPDGSSISSGAALSADGRRIAVGYYDNSVVEWDLGTGEIASRSSPTQSGHFLSTLTYIRDSKRIAAGSTDGTVRIWDSAHLDDQPTIIGRPGSTPIFALTSSQDGSMLVAVDSDHQIREWRTSDWREIRKPIPGPTATIRSVAVSPDGRHIAVASVDAAVHIYDAQTGDPVATLIRHGDSVNSVTFAKDSSHILTSSDDGTAAVFTCEACGYQSFSSVLARAEQLDKRG